MRYWNGFGVWGGGSDRSNGDALEATRSYNFKLNTDAVVAGDNCRWGCGAVIRDSMASLLRREQGDVMVRRSFY